MVGHLPCLLFSVAGLMAGHAHPDGVPSRQLSVLSFGLLTCERRLCVQRLVKNFCHVNVSTGYTRSDLPSLRAGPFTLYLGPDNVPVSLPTKRQKHWTCATCHVCFREQGSSAFQRLERDRRCTQPFLSSLPTSFPCTSSSLEASAGLAQKGWWSACP